MFPRKQLVVFRDLPVCCMWWAGPSKDRKLLVKPPDLGAEPKAKMAY